MRCPICGRQIDNEWNLCPNCGTDFAVLDESRKAVPAAVPLVAPTPGRNRKSKKWIPITSALAVVLLVAGIVFSLLGPESEEIDDSYILCTNDITLGSSQDAIAISINGNVIYDRAGEHNYSNVQKSLDGSVCAYLRDYNYLTLVNDEGITVIDMMVTSYQLSADGTGIIYSKNQLWSSSLFSGSLYYYTEELGSVCIRDGGLAILDYCISPDGDCLAFTYLENMDSEHTLVLYRNNQEKTLTTGIYSLHGMSDDGELIYGSQRGNRSDTLYCIDSKGRKTVLGDMSEEAIHLNADHSQILFYQDGCTYLSDKGKNAQRLLNQTAEPLTPPNTLAARDYHVTTQPVKNLYNKVYLSAQGFGLVTTSAWYVTNNSARILVSPVDYCTLDSSGQYLYYLQGSKLHYLSVTNPAIDNVCLTQDVFANRFCLNSDGSRILYSTEKTVQICSATTPEQIKIEPVLISDAQELPLFAADAKGNLYYTLENRLYFTNGEQGAVHILDGEVISMEASQNGFVYVCTQEKMYLASAGNPPIPLWENSYNIEFTHITKEAAE